MYYAAKFGQYMYRGRPHDVRFNDRWHTFTPTAAKGKRSRYRWTGSEVSDFFFLFSIFLAAYFSKFLPFRRSNSPSCVVVTLTWYRYLLPICTFRNAISEKLEVTAVRASYKCLAAFKSCTVMSCSEVPSVKISVDKLRSILYLSMLSATSRADFLPVVGGRCPRATVIRTQIKTQNIALQ